MLKRMQNAKYIAVWAAFPVAFTAVFPWAEGDPRHVDWLLTAILLYVLFFSVVVHELSHGAAARACGDLTAERAGRLTLNPVSHVSVFGSIVLPIALYLFKAPVFGWAKPVPFDARNLKEHPRDQVWLAMAGPLSNFCLSFACYMLYLLSAPVFKSMNPEIALRIPLDLFTPLDLSGAGFEAFWFVWFEILAFGIVLNVILGVFNLIPFPPLDGSWILKAVLPKKAAAFYAKVQAYGFVLIILAVQFNLLDVFLYPLAIVVGAVDFLGNWSIQALP